MERAQAWESYRRVPRITLPDVSNIFKPFEITPLEVHDELILERLVLNTAASSNVCLCSRTTSADKHPANRRLQRSDCCNAYQRKTGWSLQHALFSLVAETPRDIDSKWRHNVIAFNRSPTQNNPLPLSLSASLFLSLIIFLLKIISMLKIKRA